MLAAAGSATAVSLHQGDLVALDTHFGTPYTMIVRLIPGTGVVDLVASHGLLADGGASDLTVLRDGRVLVSTDTHGVVAVDPADGSQSVYRTETELGGRVSGLAVEPEGTVLMLVHAGGSGRIVRHDPADGSLAEVTSGSDLSDAGDIACGPAGDVFVSVRGTPGSNGAFGSILRLSAQGARLATFVSDQFRGPGQLGVTGNGRVYAANGGAMAAGYGGCVTRTDIATGITATAVGSNACEGVAVVSPELVYYSRKTTTKAGEYWSVERMFPTGWGVSGVTGPIEAVILEPVSTHASTWGGVKRAYR